MQKPRRIEYYANDERVILLDKARVWETGDEEFRSDRIVFNLKTDTVDAGGGGDSGRVHITLQPKDKDRDKKDSNKDRPDNDPILPVPGPEEP